MTKTTEYIMKPIKSALKYASKQIYSKIHTDYRISQKTNKDIMRDK